MSTYIALHAQTDQSEKLAVLLSDWLKSAHQTNNLSISRAADIDEIYTLYTILRPKKAG
jgi:hypothetical protein